jgi:Spy/CpxP family protein refolding chaperone
MYLKKHILLTIAGLVLISAVLADAQYQPMPKRSTQYQMPDSAWVNSHVSMLTDSLNLTDEQAQKIHAILMNEQHQLVANREKYRANTRSLDKAQANLRKNTDKQIKELLNKEQQKKFDRLEKDTYKSRRYPYDHRTDPPRKSNRY